MRFATLAFVVATAFLLAPGVTAHGVVAHVSIEAFDGGCPGAASRCFKVVNSFLSDLAPGEPAEFSFRNRGTQAHSLFVATTDHADPARKDTAGDARFAGTTQAVEPAGTAFFSATVPEGAPGVHLWSDEPGDEEAGMWLERAFTPTTQASHTPAPGGGLVAFAVIAALTLGVRWTRRGP